MRHLAHVKGSDGSAASSYSILIFFGYEKTLIALRSSQHADRLLNRLRRNYIHIF